MPNLTQTTEEIQVILNDQATDTTNVMAGMRYLKGDGTAVGDIRMRKEANDTVIEKLDSNMVWQPTSMRMGSDTLWLGFGSGVGTVGHHLVTEAADGHLHMHAHSEFDGETSTSDTKILDAFSYVPGMVYQGDFSGSWTGTQLGWTMNSAAHVLAKTLFLKTGTTAATEPVRLRTWEGTDDTGVLIIDMTMGAAMFPVSSDISINTSGFIEYSEGQDYYIQYDSAAAFSFQTNAANLLPYLAADTVLVREDSMLQTVPYVDGGTYTLGDWLVESRKIYICNSTGVQTGTFASNSALWDILSSADGSSNWQRDDTVLSPIVPGDSVILESSLSQPVYGSNAGLIVDIPFTEAGATQYDRSSLGNDFTNTDAVCNATNGKYGYGGFFNGSSAKMDIAYDASMNASIFTASFWAKVTGGVGTYRSPLTSRESSPKRGFTIYASDTNQWEFMFGDSSDWHTIVGPVVVIDEWVHIAVVIDGTNQYFYIDGVEVGSHTYSYSPNTVYPYRIGAGATEGPGDMWFFGNISEVKIFNRALAIEEIRTQYLNRGGDSVVKSNVFRVLDTSDNTLLLVSADDFTFNDGTRDRLKIDTVETKIVSDSGAVALILNGSLATMHDGTRNRMAIDGGSTQFASPSGANFVLVNDTKVDLVTPKFTVYDGANNRALLDSTGTFLYDERATTPGYLSLVNESLIVNDGSENRILTDSIKTLLSAPDGSSHIDLRNGTCEINDGTKDRVLVNATKTRLEDETTTAIGFLELANKAMSVYDGTRERIGTTSTLSHVTSPDGTSSVSISNAGVTITGSLLYNREIYDINGPTATTPANASIMAVYDTANEAVTVTLATVVLERGRTISVIDTGGNASTNNITIDTEGTAKINGADSMSLIIDYSSMSLVCDGANWFSALAE